jgi:hypothetical protein
MGDDQVLPRASGPIKLILKRNLKRPVKDVGLQTLHICVCDEMYAVGIIQK